MHTKEALTDPSHGRLLKRFVKRSSQVDDNGMIHLLVRYDGHHQYLGPPQPAQVRRLLPCIRNPRSHLYLNTEPLVITVITVVMMTNTKRRRMSKMLPVNTRLV